MSPIRSILVHMDDAPHGAARLRLAQQLAEQNEAQATALYVSMPPFMQFSMTYGGGVDVVPILQEHEKRRRDAVRAVFDKQAADKARLRWAEATGEPTWTMSRHALLADLLVLGQRDAAHERNSGLPFDFVESVLLASGRPTLVVPTIGTPERVGRIALVAWKESREAARALTAALPLLQHAEQVHVETWDDASLREVGETPLDVLQALREHGVKAQLHRHGPASRDVGEFMLSRAADLGADLLVMGCYGHGRAREWALGGASRTVLQSMTVPVLMAH